MKKYDDEIIACDFNTDEFPDFKADTCLCAMTAEYVAELPKFLRKVCNAAQKQILMICRPIDKEIHTRNRWHNQLLTDFTEKFLIKTMQENNFAVNFAEPFADNASFVLYDFRKISAESAEKNLPPVDENKNNFFGDDENFSPADNDENNFTVDDENISSSDDDENFSPAEGCRPFGEFKIETAGEEKNNYGLSDTIVKTCEFLGLKLPEKNSSDDKKHVPSDYLGKDFELNEKVTEKLLTERNFTKERFKELYTRFRRFYFAQKSFKHTKTDLNIYFADFMLFANQNNYNTLNYFNFKFYEKPLRLQNSFVGYQHLRRMHEICNEFSFWNLLKSKATANKLFAEFVHRDWINPKKSTLSEFKKFIGEHPKFFAKSNGGFGGKSAEIVQINSDTNVEELFKKFRSNDAILEEIISQHEIMKTFCPDTLNTVRVSTLVDVHGEAHIVTACGRFGRTGKVVDNYTSGGFSVIIDPKTGVITSDGMNKRNELFDKHPDTGKIFKGFQYPFWQKIRDAAKKMAKVIPALHHVGWDIAINAKGEPEFVEGNSDPGSNIYQVADSIGKLALYKPIVRGLEKFQQEQMNNLGYRVNNRKTFRTAYNSRTPEHNQGATFAMKKLIPDCKSLMDLGCRKDNFTASILPANVKYIPVDYRKRGDDTIICDISEGKFPEQEADTCLCSFTAEYVMQLPKFLKNLCTAAQKQILFVCRPVDKENNLRHRWRHPFLTDFTEKFLIDTVEAENFKLHSSENLPEDSAVILYDFRRTAPTVEKIVEPIREEKNIYGLSEGVIKACEFFGLKLPQKTEGDSTEHLPSDYFGENFELDLATMEKLRLASKLDKEKFSKTYGRFTRKFFSQKAFKHNETDLNIYFADYVLFAKKIGAMMVDYFDFEFYKKSAAEQKTFRMQIHRERTRSICNPPVARNLLNNKSLTNELFGDFIHRDWINTLKCTFEDFKNFTAKNPRFFSKPIVGSLGKGAEIIQTEPNTDFEKLFSLLREKKRLLEGVIVQHEALSAFCPDTVNTLRINTFLDVHNDVHILTTGGRFGRVGRVVDNFHGGGFSVVINPETGVVISDGINRVHERSEIHPDTGKKFRGFQYPSWEKICETIVKMAKTLPQMRHVGWDVAINDKGEAELVEANGNPDVDVQQAADSVGRLYLYKPLIDELRTYKKNRVKSLGYCVNNIGEFFEAYENDDVRRDERVSFAMKNLIAGCKNLVDLGCRQSKFVKTICPETTKYIPVDFKNYSDAEIISCNFNDGDFPKISADTYFCAITAEYVSALPEFLKNMCNFAQKQILMLCRPDDTEQRNYYRWNHPFLTDFTEEFLIKTMQENNFAVNEIKLLPDNRSIILYDFRKK